MADLWPGRNPRLFVLRGEEGQFVFVRAEQFAARQRLEVDFKIYTVSKEGSSFLRAAP